MYRITYRGRKERCSTLECLYKILTNKFRSQIIGYNKITTVSQIKQTNGENADEWMGRLWLSARECNYKEIDRQLKEQFIHGLNDTEILGGIIKELTQI